MFHKIILLIFTTVVFHGFSTEKAKPQKHLFILSGQSNMAALNPKVSFIPAVEKEYGKENVLVVKNAHSGRPIRKWYRDYQYPKGHSKYQKYVM